MMELVRCLQPIIITIFLLLSLPHTVICQTTHDPGPITTLNHSWKRVVTPYNGSDAIICPNITASATTTEVLHPAGMLSKIPSSSSSSSSMIPSITAISTVNSVWTDGSAGSQSVSLIDMVTSSMPVINNPLVPITVSSIKLASSSITVSKTNNSYIFPSPAAPSSSSENATNTIVALTSKPLLVSSSESLTGMSMSSLTSISENTWVPSDASSSKTLPSITEQSPAEITTIKPASTLTSTAFSTSTKHSPTTTRLTIPYSSPASSTSVSTSAPVPLFTTTYHGFNIINQSPSNPSKLKSQQEWDDAFRHVRNLPGNFNAVRLYSTTDGDVKHLLNALPAAKNQNLSMHVGVWSGGDLHRQRFLEEKVALSEATAIHGCANIVAVSVGNEDMYSNHRQDAGRTPLTNIMLLVNQTQEVRQILDRHGCQKVKITHTDTFGDWLNTNISEPLIQQVDFLTVNIFPYWSSQHIDVAGQTFFQQLRETEEMAAKYNKEIWIGETGWPTSGNIVGEAVPSIENARKYWDQVSCKLMRNMSAFWYVEYDAGMTPPSFGMMDATGDSLLGDLTCN